MALGASCRPASSHNLGSWERAWEQSLQPEVESEAASLLATVKVLLLAPDESGCLEKGPGLGAAGPAV